MSPHFRSLTMILLFSLNACVSRPPAAVPAADNIAARTAWEKGQREFSARDFEQALQSLTLLANTRGFSTLSATEQLEALAMAGRAATELHQDRASWEFSRRATEIPGASPATWLARARSAQKAQEVSDEILSLATYFERSPEPLKLFRNEILFQTLRDAARLPVSSGLELRYLRALYHAHWVLRDGQEPSYAWEKLALRLLEHGDEAEAAEVSTHIKNPDALIEMHIDRRFDPIVANHPDQFDVDAAASRQLRFIEAAVEREPQSLENKNSLIEALLRRQRYSAALEVTDSIEADRAGHQGDSNYLTRMESDYNWTLDLRAHALTGLNRWEEAVLQLETANHLPENGSDNVSQAINLAELNNDVERPDQALVILNRVKGPLSPYGAAAAALERVRANVQLREEGEVAASLKFLSDHREDSLKLYQLALSDAGELDAAAQLMIERLTNPETRLEALDTVQHFAESPSTPVTAAEDARWEAVLARPEVRAAIEKVGRIETFSLRYP